ncbi:MAG TPA: Spy/CpxP family protein refolding chaperone [Myxococcales bacterium]|jgi:Spy/CpxP family protein refolding chaperone
MTRKILIGLGALAVVIAAGAAWAHGPGRGVMMKQMISKRVAEAEDLVQATPQQRAQIEKSRDKILAAFEARHKDRGQTHQNLMALLTADTLNPNDLYAIANQRAKDIQDMAQVIVPEIVAVHDVLTPEQRVTLAAKAKELRQNHHQHKGGFGGPGE